ncbi:uncharacterized protein GGS25DRAFT_496638 [Hypoxylon fragiforme]|uniref:uncharacterized protein n=1 Tax=Hypoxylon fragiforme TaxID=63214 RepID=UPI0020C71807|nr:uncharacterized protein GGS25DRAFT_496638 [Hypoxylon fragiforme]KAI2607583.1 hypothetical protein GGS25DRAFT_496638 [Hypoxylon fragiforme]
MYCLALFFHPSHKHLRFSSFREISPVYSRSSRSRQASIPHHIHVTPQLSLSPTYLNTNQQLTHTRSSLLTSTIQYHRGMTILTTFLGTPESAMNPPFAQPRGFRWDDFANTPTSSVAGTPHASEQQHRGQQREVQYQQPPQPSAAPQAQHQPYPYVPQITVNVFNGNEPKSTTTTTSTTTATAKSEGSSEGTSTPAPVNSKTDEGPSPALLLAQSLAAQVTSLTQKVDENHSSSPALLLAQSLAAQVAALAQKVEQLSLLTTKLSSTPPPPAITVPIIDTGTWETFGVRTWNEARVHRTSGPVKFGKKFAKPPKVVVGIGMADVGNDANFRVSTYATEVTEEGFVAHADSWHDANIFGCGVSWIAVGE